MATGHLKNFSKRDICITIIDNIIIINCETTLCVNSVANKLQRTEMDLRQGGKKAGKDNLISCYNNSLLLSEGSKYCQARTLHFNKIHSKLSWYLNRSTTSMIINPYLPNGLSHPYQLDQSIFHLRGVWCTFFFIFISYFIEIPSSKRCSDTR